MGSNIIIHQTLLCSYPLANKQPYNCLKIISTLKSLIIKLTIMSNTSLNLILQQYKRKQISVTMQNIKKNYTTWTTQAQVATFLTYKVLFMEAYHRGSGCFGNISIQCKKKNWRTYPSTVGNASLCNCLIEMLIL